MIQGRWSGFALDEAVSTRCGLLLQRGEESG